MAKDVFKILRKHYLSTLIAIVVLGVFTSVILAGLYYYGYFGTHYILTKTDFYRLPGWYADDQRQAFTAFQQSCTEIRNRKTNTQFGIFPQSGTVKDWQVICQNAEKIKNPDEATARKFFETWFTPYLLTNHLNSRVLFTGYYLPLLNGNLKADNHYNVPIYSTPNDLIKIKISLFGKQYKGKKALVGMLKNQVVYPYYDRKAINNGAIKNQAKVLVWIDSLVDVFFAQIQGSAIVKLPDNSQILIGYDGDNGRAYTSVGKVLSKKKEFQRKSVSMQNIRAWLAQHPSEVNETLNRDASYVFFRILKSANPYGSQHVPLTTGRSLAVDTKLIPCSVPVWVKTSVPDREKKSSKFLRLMIAQDTGGAIKNMHGDIYLGAGQDAAYVAGQLKNDGSWWLLLPRVKSSN